jgi:hypothetical protein
MKRGRIGSSGLRYRLLGQALLGQHVLRAGLSGPLSTGLGQALLGQQVYEDLSLLALVRHYSLPPGNAPLSLSRGVGLVALAESEHVAPRAFRSTSL